MRLSMMTLMVMSLLLMMTSTSLISAQVVPEAKPEPANVADEATPTDVTLAPTRYRLTVKNTRRVRIDITVDGLAFGSAKFQLPAWKPGAYRILAWHKQVEDVTAKGSGGRVLEVASTGKREWTVRGDHGGEVTLSYFYKVVPTNRSDTWVCCEGPETWMYPVGRLGHPCVVDFDFPVAWRIRSGLTATSVDPRRFTAPDYDTFADCPIEIGDLTIDTWSIDGLEYRNVYNQEPRFDREAMQDMCTKIVRWHLKMFGEAPYSHYDFLWHLQPRQVFFGGLEHLNSTTLWFPGFALRASVLESASLVAHEFFHLWNIKRIRPKNLGPFDYTGPVRTKALWLSEGVTDYYAEVCCVRTGLWSPSRYRIELASHFTALRNSRAYTRESVEEASMKVWDRPMFGTQGDGLDYYNAGKILGLLLDIEIRTATSNRRSLDDVMRLLMRRYGLPKPGFVHGDIRRAVNEVAGRDLSGWFNRYVADREAYPIEATLKKAGLDVEGLADPVLDRAATTRRFTGIEVEDKGGDDESRWTVTAIAPSGEDAAAVGGGKTLEKTLEKTLDRVPLRIGDVVERFGRVRPRRATRRTSFFARNLRRALRGAREPGSTLSLAIVRDGQSMTLDVPIDFTKTWKHRVRNAETDDSLARAIRQDLFEAEKKPSGTESGRRSDRIDR